MVCLVAFHRIARVIARFLAGNRLAPKFPGHALLYDSAYLATGRIALNAYSKVTKALSAQERQTILHQHGETALNAAWGFPDIGFV